ncbi:MAG: ABC transporter substrate-binding protein [Rikenellaceae bacterium]
MLNYVRIFCLCYIFLLSSCADGGSSKVSGVKQVALSDKELSEIAQVEMVKYAEGFKVKDFNGVKLVEITDPTTANSAIYRYALVPRNREEEVVIPQGYEPLEVPLSRVICMTTLQLSPFIKLGDSDKIVGVTSTRFLHNEQLGERLKSGSLSRIGIEGEFDTEVVLSIDPELILISPFKRGGYDSVKNLGVPMLAYLGYKELSALGQAEWIKLVGLLLGTEEKANSTFAAIEERYTQLVDLVKDVEDRPTVLSGELHSGNWYVVGGKSPLAQQFRDAGADYFMQNNNESGGFYVDYESVYAQGHDADFWRILNNFEGEYNYDKLLASDSRYLDFKAFEERNVIYCNLRTTPFYENTPMEPEVILADLIKIFHPDRLQDHQPKYYYKLQE